MKKSKKAKRKKNVERGAVPAAPLLMDETVLPIQCPRCHQFVEDERDMLILINDLYWEVMCGQCYYDVNNDSSEMNK